MYIAANTPMVSSTILFPGLQAPTPTPNPAKTGKASILAPPTGTPLAPAPRGAPLLSSWTRNARSGSPAPFWAGVATRSTGKFPGMVIIYSNTHTHKGTLKDKHVSSV